MTKRNPSHSELTKTNAIDYSFSTVSKLHNKIDVFISQADLKVLQCHNGLECIDTDNMLSGKSIFPGFVSSDFFKSINGFD